MKWHLQSLCSGLICLAVVAASIRYAAAESIPAANLMVRLDGTSAAVGTGENAGKVQVWYDQIFTVGDEAATQQDFGVLATQTANMPTLVTFAFPTGARPVLDFNREATSGNSSAASDFLSSKAGGEPRAAFGGTFTPGGDPAYDTVSDGISWFVLFQTDVLLQTAGSGASQNSRQALLRTSTSAHTDMWSAAVQDTGDAGNVVDAFGQVRNTAGGAASNIFSDLTDQWYILGNSWNPVAGALQTVLFDQTGAQVGSTLSATAVNTNVGNHAITRISLLPTSAAPPGSTSNALDGRIAEILVYDVALDAAGMTAVTDYLTNTYFVPEPGAWVLLLALALSGTLVRRRNAQCNAS